MRCKYKIRKFGPALKNWDGKSEIIDGPLIIIEQCQKTTHITTAKCWRNHQMCGLHACQTHPEQYPKGPPPKRGGRYGHLTNEVPLLQMLPSDFNRRK